MEFTRVVFRRSIPLTQCCHGTKAADSLNIMPLKSLNVILRLSMVLLNDAIAKHCRVQLAGGLVRW
jgi:hypothetical protein